MHALLLVIPLWLGLLLSLLYPYQGLAFSKWGIVALFLLGILNTIGLDINVIKNRKSVQTLKLLPFIGGYVFFPAIQLILAFFLVSDPFLQLGVLFAAISPTAMIAPQFFRVGSNERGDAVYYFLISTIAYPLLITAYMHLFDFQLLDIPILPMVKDVLIVTILPVLMSLSLKKFRLYKKIIAQKNMIYILQLANLILVGFLIFTYFGSTLIKINLDQYGLFQIIAVFGLAFFQNFGTFFFFRKFGASDVDSISFSIKNVALSGGILSVFSPQSILACSSVFVAHAGLISFLVLRFKYLKNSTASSKSHE